MHSQRCTGVVTTGGAKVEGRLIYGLPCVRRTRVLIDQQVSDRLVEVAPTSFPLHCHPAVSAQQRCGDILVFGEEIGLQYARL